MFLGFDPGGAKVHYFKPLLLHGLLPVFIGGMIYIIWRSTTLWMFDWFAALRITGLINALRMLAFPVPGWFIYSLPSGLWLYSFSFSLNYVWVDAKTPYRFFWLALAPVAAIGSELGQLAGFVPGTYDHADLGLYVVALTLSFLAVLWIKSNKDDGRVSSEE